MGILGKVKTKAGNLKETARRAKYAKYYKNLLIDDKVILYDSYFGRGMICNPYALFLALLDNEDFQDYTHVWVIEDKYGNEPDAQDLLRIAVSGILFDNVKPSAIITINGIDYFVQKGDMVDDYVVLDINRQFVVVKKGTNIYKAGVGERFAQNPQISGAAVYGSGGARQYKSNSDYTSASDVEIHAVEEN